MAHGAIIFIEIPVRDLQRSADFYAGAFGWSFESESPTTWLFNPGGRGAMGSITTNRRPSSDGTRLYLEVEDIDVTISAARTLGGRLERGRTVETATLGDSAVIRDPNGTWLGLFQSRLGDVLRKDLGDSGASEAG